jgi:hypothetical protein
MRRASILVLALIAGSTARADWKIQYTGEAARMFGSTPRGSFATSYACELYRQGRPAFEFNRSRCVGFNSGGGGYAYQPGYYGGGSRGFAAQMLGGLMQNFMQGYQQGLRNLAAERRAAAERQAAAERRRAEEARRIEEFKAWQQRIREDIARQETQFRDLRRQEVVQESRVIGGVLARRLQSQAPLVNPQADRLLQSACWSRKAALAAVRGDEAGAEEARAHAARALEGAAPPCTDDLPAVPMPATPAPAGGLSAELGQLVREETGRVEVQIQELMARQLKSREAMDQRREAVHVREQAKAQATDPAAQAEADRLLAEARKALEEAMDESMKLSQELGSAQDALEALKAVGTLTSVPASPGGAK